MTENVLFFGALMLASNFCGSLILQIGNLVYYRGRGDFYYLGRPDFSGQRNIQLFQLTLSDESSKPRPQSSMGSCK